MKPVCAFFAASQFSAALLAQKSELISSHDFAHTKYGEWQMLLNKRHSHDDIG